MSASQMSDYSALPKVGSAPDATATPPFDVDTPAANQPDVDPATAAAEAKPTATALALLEVTNNIAEFDSVEAGLQAIEKKYGGVMFDVETPKGFAAAKEARAEVRKPRYAVQKAVENAKAPLNTLKAAIKLRGDDIIKRIAAVEDPIDQQVKAEEKRRTEEKERLEREAAQKKAEIDGAILEITSRVEACIDQPADFIGETILWLDNTEITEEDFGDRADEARRALQATRDRLVGMKATAEAAELAAANAKIMADQLKAQQEELARQKEALDRREAIGNRIDAIHATPDVLVEASAEQLRSAIATLEALDPELYGPRLREAQRAAAAVLPDLQALLAAAEEEEEEAEEPVEVEPPPPTAPTPAPTPAPAPTYSYGSPRSAPVSLGDAPEVAAPAPVSAPTARTYAAPTRPTDDQIVSVLSLYFRVHESKVIEWLLSFDAIAASNRLTQVDD